MFTMFQAFHRLVCWTVIIVAVFGAAAKAQLTPKVTFKAPFAFEVGSRTCPAGEYELEYDPHSRVVKVTHVESSARVMLLANVLLDPGRALSPKVVFQNYGSSAFPFQAWFGPVYGGVQFQPSDRERELIAAKRTSAPVVLEAKGR
ncbi:MAG: hypothetical protein SFV18_20870 [Bryobacteraceae bacterium]|nr:hypothetical protein [Bryobacteraceae bacterium]